VAGESCRDCREWPSALKSARYAYVLSSPVDDLVHGLKYEGWSRLAEPMGEALAALALPDHGSARRVVVPVPTSDERLRRRGYNQAALLARAFAARCDYPCRELLRRTASGPSQTTLHPSQRRANVAGVFAPAPRAARLARGAHLLLVDDVLTTGATAAEAAETLIRMGAAGVTAVAYARAFPNAPGAEP
jgi:ComF family protein